jgi:hypothetical protein
LWIGLALVAATMQCWVAVSVALLEIIVGAVAGNLVDLRLTPWVNYLAGFGAILLTFRADADRAALVPTGCEADVRERPGARRSRCRDRRRLTCTDASLRRMTPPVL